MLYNCLLVAIGGFFGAVTRYGVSLWMKNRFPSRFPFGTFAVNMLGSFGLGLLLGSNAGHSLQLLLGTGFMGAFTTFSTLKLEKLQLGLQKDWRVFLLYTGITYTLGILLAFAGMAVGAGAR